MIYWVLRAARRLVRWLPVGFTYGAAGVISDLAWMILPVQRENAIDNMAHVLGSPRDAPEARRKARASFRYYAMYIVDFLRLPYLSVQEMESRLRFTGWEQIDKALGEGKGVIFISAHVGNWDISAAILARRGYPVNVVAETFHPKRLNDLVQGHRAEHGMRVIPLENAARRVLATLRKNEILGLMIDRPLPESGVAVRFFGGLTEVPGGAGLLAVKTGAKVISGVTIRNPDHTYTGLVNSHPDVELTGDLAMDVKLATQRIMDSMEAFIREYPEQWFIFRPMWPKDAPARAC